MKVNIAPTAKYIVKASSKLREEKALNAIESFYNEIEAPLAKNDYITPQFMLEKFKKIFPGIKIRIKNQDKNPYYGFHTYNEANNKVIGHDICMNFMDKVAFLSPLIQVLMHESTHMALDIFSPKYIRNSKIKSPKLLKHFEKFYRKYLYNPTPNVTPKLDNLLDGAMEKLSGKEKIKFLKSCRRYLKSENLAFQQGYKFEEKFNRLKKNPDTLEIIAGEKELLNNYDFEGKIKVIEKRLLKELKNERKVIHNNIELYGKAYPNLLDRLKA